MAHDHVDSGRRDRDRLGAALVLSWLREWWPYLAAFAVTLGILAGALLGVPR